MGVVKAVVGLTRGAAGGRNDDFEAAQAIRDATLDDGIKHIRGAIDNLAELDRRLQLIEGELVGSGVLKLGDLPARSELGLEGAVPRLMEAALVIGALTRRMHLRLGMISGALGCGARPVVSLEGEAVRAEPARTQTARADAVRTPAKPAGPRLDEFDYAS